MKIVMAEDKKIHVIGRVTSEEETEFKETLFSYTEGQSREHGTQDAKKSSEAGRLVLELSELSYISSCGLRVFFELKRKGVDLLLENVTPEVYEIFYETGLTRVMDIRRQRRTVSVEGLPLVGVGASASVYRLDEDRIIKVFVPEMSEDFVYQENEITRQAFLSGIDTMVAYDIVSTEKGLGAIYECINARDLIDCLKEDHSRIPELIAQFGRFVRASHKNTLDGNGNFPEAMDDMRNLLGRYDILGIDKETSERLLDLLEQMIPPSDAFSHGDCHAGNVMVKDNGDLMFIDVGRMSRGHAVFDLISMFVQYRYASFRNVEKMPVSRFAEPFSDEERLLIWKTYFTNVTGIEDEALTYKAEEQISVIAGVRMLAGKIVHKNFLPKECYDRFIREALDYAEAGAAPLVF